MLRALRSSLDRFEPVHCLICGHLGRPSEVLVAAGPLLTTAMFVGTRCDEPAHVGIGNAISPDSRESLAQPARAPEATG